MSEQRLTAVWVQDWMERAHAVFAAERVALIELDRAIGDGDHGENMDRGMTAVAKRLAADAETSQETPTPAALLKTVATTVMANVGGAAGPLFGTAFLRAAKATDSVSAPDGELDGHAVATALEAALGGLQSRGKAEVGEKTMVDAWAPAAQAAREAAEAGGDATAVLAAAAHAAEEGADATVPMIATKGRASYLGPRSAGYRDPGAVSTVLLLRTATEAALELSAAAEAAAGEDAE
ncbi:dihydroxyacetone kinase DhaL subunit [Bogoriella caseilytica]|uniref:Dihydroxyacetone kinase DhaL subunit n=2 Tax=Bogoriella caseilytica TaxID=56055 RepID=A0A3N2BFH0_9MICO|nr:dihydroxyacetone kinase DhaL subunit [Bogoriella caseilytica]